MAGKRIVILNGHPADASLSRSFATAYADACPADIRLHHLSEMDFDMDYGVAGYDGAKPLEPILERALQDIEWCEHFVLTTPMWWGGVPGKLKGFFDRVLMPGRTFDTRNANAIGLPKPMLTGRSARVIITADTPSFFLRLAYGNAIRRQIKGQILGFVGFKPVRFSYFASASHPKDGQAERWIEEVRTLGARGD
ncbi:MAG: NAD(P)H-dependent oxidoreductase [Pseudomonadota bacterium]